MARELLFLDSNVFMYAAGSQHPLKDPCVRILSDLEQGHVQCVTSAEVLQEILYRFGHLQIPAKGIMLCRSILNLPIQILAVSEKEIRLALDIYGQHCNVGLQPRDAIHAATMECNGIKCIVTADQGFDVITSLTRIDPARYSTA